MKNSKKFKLLNYVLLLAVVLFSSCTKEEFSYVGDYQGTGGDCTGPLEIEFENVFDVKISQNSSQDYMVEMDSLILDAYLFENTLKIDRFVIDECIFEFSFTERNDNLLAMSFYFETEGNSTNCLTLLNKQ